MLLLLTVAWARGPWLLQALRSASTPPAQLADGDAPAPELYSQAVEDLRLYYREGNVDRAIARLDRRARAEVALPQCAEARLSLGYWRRNSISADPEWQKRAQAHAERAVADNEHLAVAHLATAQR